MKRTSQHMGIFVHKPISLQSIKDIFDFFWRDALATPRRVPGVVRELEYIENVYVVSQSLEWKRRSLVSCLLSVLGGQHRKAEVVDSGEQFYLRTQIPIRASRYKC